MGIFPLAAGVVSSAFAIALLRQFGRRRGPHQLAWGLAMAAFALASLSATLGMMLGWTAAYYRSYYLFGAVLNVPILALGTLYLYLPRRAGHIAAAVVLVACLVAAFALWSQDLVTAVDGVRGSIPAGSEVVPPEVRTLSRYYSYSGFVVVVAGAVWSALRLWRRPELRLRRLAQGNALIALGTLVVALGSAFARQGAGTIFAVGLATGVTVMFAGFLRTRTVPATQPQPVPDPVPQSLAGKAAG